MTSAFAEHCPLGHAVAFKTLCLHVALSYFVPFSRGRKKTFFDHAMAVFFSPYLGCLDVLIVSDLAAGCCSIRCPNGGHCIVHMHWLGEIVTAFLRDSSCWQQNNSLIQGTSYLRPILSLKPSLFLL